jgi:NAD(P)H-dependent FMN reductase
LAGIGGDHRHQNSDGMLVSGVNVGIGRFSVTHTLQPVFHVIGAINIINVSAFLGQFRFAVRALAGNECVAPVAETSSTPLLP